MWRRRRFKSLLAETALKAETPMKLLLVVSGHGGAQAKQAQVIRVNAAATLRLQQGYELHQVSKLMDQLLRSISTQCYRARMWQS